jgi:pimeloyl-ACP methyl ester carboxylesterase
MADDAGLGGVATAHQRAGRRFDAAGVGSFVREEGAGEPVVLVHGLPSSSFLYRKMLPELASRGLRALAFDLPGLGLADRPADFDYTFAGLGGFAAAAVDALGLERFHLVVHDAGGPVGFEMAAGMPERIRSLTILNTVVTMDKVPFVMEVYARGAAGREWPAMPPARVLRRIFRAVGVADQGAISDGDIDAYRELVLREDDGAAYLRIMANLRRGHGDYRAVVDSRSTPYPVQVVWGTKDPVLPFRRHGWRARDAAHVPAICALPAKHYLQEEQAPAISELVALHAARA